MDKICGNCRYGVVMDDGGLNAPHVEIECRYDPHYAYHDDKDWCYRWRGKVDVDALGAWPDETQR